MQNNTYVKTAPGVFFIDRSVLCVTGVILARYRESLLHCAKKPTWSPFLPRIMLKTLRSVLFAVSASGALHRREFYKKRRRRIKSC